MSIQPDKKNFKIWKGATFRQRIVLYQPNSTTLPENLSGYTGEMIIRDKPEGTPVLTLNTLNGGVTLGGSAGTIDLFIDATDTAAITWKSAVYDLTITGGGDDDTTALLYGGISAQGV